MKNKTTTLLIALSVIFILTIGLIYVPAEEQTEIVTNTDTEPSAAAAPSETTPDPVETIEPAAAEQYPQARLIWDTMISWGWSPETCAGIIGNMMAEIGGGTLDLSDWDSNGGCGYGLIQWTGERRSSIKNRYDAYPNIQQQLTFMKDELFGTNNTEQQVSDDNLKVIMNSNGEQTPESIAYCFASYYERCASQHRAKRQGYARIAYEYFINK